MKNKTLNKACEYKNSMTLKEFLDYFNKQDLPVTDFMGTKEFMEYSVSNNMTTLRLVNELRSDPRAREREEKRFMEKEVTEKSNIESGVLDSKKFFAHCEGTIDTQFKRKSDSSEGNGQVRSNKDKAIADDEQSSVEPQVCTST